ncbi:hypothetical protein [Telmatospirillum sp. J64-1]|uniref:hypothetical protein n=1 Tax=Telmatospirillum sp. J64-1 TaxID=2502183 RepID=UPI00115D208A|nr:hypothetical protein [Telmatospirillum sp. J64-1]
MNETRISSADYGNQALRELCRLGGSTRQSIFAQGSALPPERIGPVLAGLHHNRYIARDFSEQDPVISLTDQGRDWARRRGLDVPDAPAPQAGQPAALRQQARQEAPARPAPQQTPPAPQPPAKKVSDAVKAGLGPRRTAKAVPQDTQPPAVTPAPAPAETPAPEAAQPEFQLEPPPAETPAPEEGKKPARKAPARRPRKKASAEEEKKGEVETDESGFVTRIGGKNIH